jgi:hypothetical protein
MRKPFESEKELDFVQLVLQNLFVNTQINLFYVVLCDFDFRESCCRPRSFRLTFRS